jgi:hypothetical protein
MYEESLFEQIVNALDVADIKCLADDSEGTFRDEKGTITIEFNGKSFALEIWELS